MDNPTDQIPEFKSNRSQPLAEEVSTPSISDGSHLDAIRMPDLEDGNIDPDAPIAVDAETGEEIAGMVEPEQVSRDGFYTLFKTGFSAPAMVAADFAPLAIQPDEEGSARAASDALYSLLEIYYPSALMPQSETFAHLLTLGMFAFAKVAVVRMILEARNEKAKQVNKPQPVDAVARDEMPDMAPPSNVVSPFAPDWGLQA